MCNDKLDVREFVVKQWLVEYRGKSGTKIAGDVEVVNVCSACEAAFYAFFNTMATLTCRKTL